MNCLPKGTASAHGFAVIPNDVVDRLIGAKHSADSIALLLYLRRHLAGQAGTIALTGGFSQSTICIDMGWGPTNLPRLKRAADTLKASGVLKTSIVDNNTVVYSIALELNPRLTKPTPKLEPEDLLHTGLEESFGPGLEESFGSTGARKNIKINIIKNLTNHLQKQLKDQPVVNAVPISANDDDIDFLLNLYRNTVSPTVSASHAAKFVELYAFNGKPFAIVKQALATIAAHPKLLKDTTSINAVWHVPHMLNSAKAFEQNVRSWLASLGRDGSIDLPSELRQAAERSGMHPDVFVAFFAAEITDVHPYAEYGVQAMPDEPTGLSVPDQVTDSTVNLAVQPESSQPTGATLAPVLDMTINTDLEGASSFQTPTFSIDQTRASQTNKTKVDQCVAELTIEAKGLLSANDKDELRLILEHTLHHCLDQGQRHSLAMIKEFADLEMTSFEMLRNMIKMRLKAPARAA